MRFLQAEKKIRWEWLRDIEPVGRYGGGDADDGCESFETVWFDRLDKATVSGGWDCEDKFRAI
ncbi:MAG TPA: hypothetical protein PLU67_02640 [Candidatus Kapabacteria bacterium]|nr:hypothetical protein [Candidatus Kapabacteria bacterium]HOM04372.1 hypothetical protein [Candidatus Kapabacteria bacterium]HPP38680.1 hypothetical protein [Candidatus Kapabacteria bacterium]